MNRDLIVFAILLLLLGLDGFGAWQFLPVLSRNAGGIAGSEPLMIFTLFSITGAVLTGFSVLVIRKIFSRLS